MLEFIVDDTHAYRQLPGLITANKSPERISRYASAFTPLNEERAAARWGYLARLGQRMWLTASPARVYLAASLRRRSVEFARDAASQKDARWHAPLRGPVPARYRVRR